MASELFVSQERPGLNDCATGLLARAFGSLCPIIREHGGWREGHEPDQAHASQSTIDREPARKQLASRRGPPPAVRENRAITGIRKREEEAGAPDPRLPSAAMPGCERDGKGHSNQTMGTSHSFQTRTNSPTATNPKRSALGSDMGVTKRASLGTVLCHPFLRNLASETRWLCQQAGPRTTPRRQ